MDGVATELIDSASKLVDLNPALGFIILGLVALVIFLWREVKAGQGREAELGKALLAEKDKQIADKIRQLNEAHEDRRMFERLMDRVEEKAARK